MQVHRAGDLRLPCSVVTVGTFDGVHRGHQALIRKVTDRSRSAGVPSVVCTFDPPPRAYFRAAVVLTPLPEKLRRLEGLGVDHVVVARFDADYADQPPSSFIDELAALVPREVWVGADFRFGRGRSGDVRTLEENFSTRVFEPLRCREGKVVSSSRVRDLLSRGALTQARELLGWEVEWTGPEPVIGGSGGRWGGAGTWTG